MSTDLNIAAGAFAPLLGAGQSTVAIAATAANQTVALPQPPGAGNLGGQPVIPPGAGSSTFCVDNTGAPATYNGTAISTALYVFVAFGATAAQAVATISSGATPGSYPCPPGEKTIITVPGNPQFVGVIANAAGPTNVYITPGNGKL
jgi:hypothetical protein